MFGIFLLICIHLVLNDLQAKPYKDIGIHKNTYVMIRHLFTHLSPYSPKWFVDKTIVPITIVFTPLGMILNLNCRHLVISKHSSNHCALFSSNRSWMWTMDIWFIRQTIVHYSIQLQSIQDVNYWHMVILRHSSSHCALFNSATIDPGCEVWTFFSDHHAPVLFPYGAAPL